MSSYIITKLLQYIYKIMLDNSHSAIVLCNSNNLSPLVSTMLLVMAIVYERVVYGYNKTVRL